MKSSTAPTSAMAVANWFIDRSSKEVAAKVPPVDQLKLYKLVYFAHAWHLGNGLGPLFDEDVEAWPHGPVVRDLYIAFKGAGRDKIGSFGTRLTARDRQLEPDVPIYRGPLEPFLENVWNAYKVHSGVQLSNATHATGEPWRIVADQCDLSKNKPTIPNELIEQVYRVKVERNHPALA